MRARMPWSVGQLVLAESEVGRGRGWDATVDRLSGGTSPHSDKVGELTEALKDHILCGEKLTRFYGAAPDEIAALREVLRSSVIAENVASAAYPSVLDGDCLNNHPEQLTLVAIENRESGIAAVFSSVRIITERIEIEREGLGEPAALALSVYDEIYAIKHSRLQALDVLWIPNEGRYVDVRVDYPTGMLRQAGEVAQDRMRHVIAEMMGRDLFVAPANLFPLIDRIYTKGGEGIVVELAFGTTTASLKHEKMRRRLSDLRQEHYHVGGKAALDAPIEPYKISVVYQQKIDQNKYSNPELSLHSNSRVSGGEQPFLADAVIRKCMGSEDFEFVRNRIEYFLTLEHPTPDPS